MSPEARSTIGIDLVRGQVLALHDLDQVAKSLSRVVEDMKTSKVTVPDLYKAEDRRKYANALPRSTTPTKKSLLATPVTLDSLTAGQAAPASSKKGKRSTGKRPKPRNTVIPKTAALNVTPPRISAIHNELLSLVADQYPNACAVLFRVFIELSTDHFIADRNLPTSKDAPLAKRLKLVAGTLRNEGAIPANLRKAVQQVADGPSPLAPGMSTFNQYVHNQYTHPKPRELYAAWDELQPFMERVWP